eukprot:6176988-Pleurochrysis_carterae.AAC.5
MSGSAAGPPDDRAQIMLREWRVPLSKRMEYGAEGIDATLAWVYHWSTTATATTTRMLRAC